MRWLLIAILATSAYAQNPFNRFRLPIMPTENTLTPSDCQMTTTGHSCAAIGYIPASEVTILTFSMGAITGGPGSVDMRLETVSATTGEPTGTLVTANANCTINVTNTEDNMTKSCTMTASYSGGGIVAVRSTITGSINIAVPSIIGQGQIPYGWSATPTGTIRSRVLLYGVKFASGAAYGFGNAQLGGSGEESWSNATNPDERGNRMVFSKTFSACGIWFRGGPNTSASDYLLKLYDSTPTALAGGTITVDGNYVANAGGQNTGDYFFPSPITISATNTYYVTLRATNNTVLLHYITVTANADLAYLYNGGIEIYKATRDNDSGAFATTNTTIYSIGLIVCDASTTGTAPNRPFFQ